MVPKAPGPGPGLHVVSSLRSGISALCAREVVGQPLLSLVAAVKISHTKSKGNLILPSPLVFTPHLSHERRHVCKQRRMVAFPFGVFKGVPFQFLPLRSNRRQCVRSCLLLYGSLWGNTTDVWAIPSCRAQWMTGRATHEATTKFKEQNVLGVQASPPACSSW